MRRPRFRLLKADPDGVAEPSTYDIEVDGAVIGIVTKTTRGEAVESFLDQWVKSRV